MSASIARQRALYWFTFIPEHVIKGFARYYIYWKVFFVLATIGHCVTLVLFWQTGVIFMAVGIVPFDVETRLSGAARWEVMQRPRSGQSGAFGGAR